MTSLQATQRPSLDSAIEFGRRMNKMRTALAPHRSAQANVHYHENPKNNQIACWVWFERKPAWHQRSGRLDWRLLLLDARASGWSESQRWAVSLSVRVRLNLKVVNACSAIWIQMLVLLMVACVCVCGCVC
ncbi:hypothetical protein M440DRAFT_1400568 [Trichoderma longibrachiatum ATCC 18648]|uniref:Uncharacterized protein n=1 Tax=Trichoderma longibrachiatum ATCC 18648 TaxID=983965 RepID=A0A2T4C7S8_TRILO|nr:hypothetical protein M440DRAFT_1400568 [Trichoderma longibrachiatum ATCC 18648]